MILKDYNQTLVKPEGFDLYDVRADGSFLRLEYNKTKYVEDPLDQQTGLRADGWTSLVIYLNDQGREVIRTETYIKIASELPTPIPVIPKPWYFRAADFILNLLNA
jgi:hypothetical protein